MHKPIIVLSCLAMICCSRQQEDSLYRDGAIAHFYSDSTVLEWAELDDGRKFAEIGDVQCVLTMKKGVKGVPSWQISISNNGNSTFSPADKAGIKLGIDTYMDTFPEWMDKYFPTLAVCEADHFYGYFQKPSGKIMALYCPQRVASWSVDYNKCYTDSFGNWFMGHRILSFNLDLILNEEPLEAGQTKTWDFSYLPISSLKNFEKEMHEAFNIPMIDACQTNYGPGEQAKIKIYCSNSELGDYLDIDLPKPGQYPFSISDGRHTTCGRIIVHEPWCDIIRSAREAAVKYHQKATSHCESWYGFYSAFEAAKYFPQPELDKALDQRFEMIFSKLYDTGEMEPIYYADRIQNTSTTIGQLVDRYEAFGREQDLLRAGVLADWMIGRYQKENGAFVLPSGVIYTSVIYIAKSVMELAIAEKDAGWEEDAERHFAAAGRAVDQLVEAKGNFETEGEMTFEDGMISCSALQIGLWALLQKDPKSRRHYTNAMLEILNSHDCLTQLRVPDGRRRGGTMRYWEAQYDVLMLPNMFNSPHGWSAWRAYATYYAYLLTGEPEWLEQSFNAAGAFSRLIDPSAGTLYWAFVVDPRVNALQATAPDTALGPDDISFDNPHPALYNAQPIRLGEQYVEMISDWQNVNTQDNDVHEVFKFISEAFLTNAFIVEQKDGTLKCYNCHAQRSQNGSITAIPNEEQIVNLHCNMRKPTKIAWMGKERCLGKGFQGWAFEDRNKRGHIEKPELERTPYDENFELSKQIITIAEFIAQPLFCGYVPGGSDYHIVEGTISKINNPSIGYIELSDNTGTMVVYGITAKRCRSLQNDHSFASLGLQEGDHVKLALLRCDYQGVPQGKGFIVN